jgi:hypothetical protein
MAISFLGSTRGSATCVPDRHLVEIAALAGAVSVAAFSL